MEKYKILYEIIQTKKRLTQEEIEKNDFEQFNNTTIFKTNNKKEAENKIKELIKHKYNDYDCYCNIYEYKRFELVQEVCVDDADYIKDISLGIFYPNYEDEENDHEEEEENE